MDKDVGIVTGFLITIFLVSFAFHLLYAKGYAFEWAIQKMEQTHEQELKQEQH